MNRRDFLHPRHLAAGANRVFGVVEAPAAETEPDDVALVRVARPAMATTFEILLPVGAAPALPAVQAAFDTIDRLEAQLSVYRAASEVSRLNAQAAAGPVRVTANLFELLELAARLTAETRGAFDISAGPLIKAWGFFRREGRVPSDGERREALERVGMRHLELRQAEQTVRFLRPGVEINLGSIGKGYALDCAAQTLREAGTVPAALLHGGHSSVYAIGSAPGSRRGWPVGLAHPNDAGRRLALIRLRDRALGTSAATFQHLEYAGRKLGHLLDPRTGWPAEGMASVSVAAPSAAEADALATAFFILGVDGARAYCARRPEIGAILLPVGAERPTILNFGPDDLQLHAAA